MPKLGVVIASVREGRNGDAVAQWVVERVRAHGGFDATLVDLKTIGLPMLSEPNHPRLQKYEQATTKAWSATVKGLDAFVFVMPEYNHGVPPALVNALNHLYAEWNYKAVAFVSYGAMSGGVRAVQMIKPTLLAMKMVPILEGVVFQFAAQLVDKETHTLQATEAHEKSAVLMLDELKKWNGALAALRS